MTSANPNTLILALETAVGTGSVAILDFDRVVAQTDDSLPHPSRAEEVLGVIRGLMGKVGIGLPDLSSVAVSIGPGSYSGIRIGVATAIGLKNALGIPCRGASLLEAIAAKTTGPTESTIVAAVPVGRNDIAWQRFQISSERTRPLSEPSLISISDFVIELGSTDRSIVRAPGATLERIDLGTGGHVFESADDDATLAAAVGQYVAGTSGDENLQPIYLRSGARV